MGSPAVRGTNVPKLHPACPGKSQCRIRSCIHNAPRSNYSTSETPSSFYEVNGIFGAYPSIKFAGGWLYQRLDTGSEGTSVMGSSDETKPTVGTMMYDAQIKIREMSGIIFDRIKSCLNAEMPV